jgi:hypothetical protein
MSFGLEDLEIIDKWEHHTGAHEGTNLPRNKGKKSFVSIDKK